MQGKFIWYDPSKGYGFIKPNDGSHDVFCHVSELQKGGIIPRVTLANAAVTFDFKPNSTRRSAINVRFLRRSDNHPWCVGIAQLPIYSHWHAAFRQRVLAAKTYKQFKHEAILATLEAVVRAARKQGWTVQHTSEYKGRVSSRYIVIRNVGICRVSNHPVVPKSKPYWNGELIISDNWTDVDVQPFMSAIRDQAALRP